MFTAVNNNPSTSSSASATAAGGTSHVGAATASSATPIPTVSGSYVNVAQQKSQGGLTGSRLAIAVLLPILVAIAAVGAYVFFVRKREAFRRAAWVDAIDKRMSRLSGDWQSMSAVGGAGATRPSIQSNRARTPGASTNGRSMSMLGGARPSVSAEPLPAATAAGPFAAEDLSQLGPRARALSEAAAAGRPISSAISAYSREEHVPPPPLPTGRSRSRSTAGLDGTGSRPSFARDPSSHGRTLSTASNNPYAPAMAQRDSQALSVEGNGLPFPASTSPVPRSRLDSNGRPIDLTNRNRVTSRVSFADVPRPSGDRRRNQSDAEKQALRASARNQSTGDEFAIDFGDAYPALACTYYFSRFGVFRLAHGCSDTLLTVMRVKSGEGLDAVAFPTADSPLTPSRDFLPPIKRTDYFDAMPNPALGGRTPDEMLKAYASAMGSNEKDGAQEQSSSTGILKKFTGLWRK